MNRKPITRLPTNWPTDKQTKRTDFDGKIIIAHPDREPHTSEDGKTWEKIDYHAQPEPEDQKVHYL